MIATRNVYGADLSEYHSYKLNVSFIAQSGTSRSEGGRALTRNVQLPGLPSSWRRCGRAAPNAQISRAGAVFDGCAIPVSVVESPNSAVDEPSGYQALPLSR